jgi:NAD(P)-dependent dehydrogenase (short-subunit alcohol dehydrogenase family)/ribosome-associated toxin RatA of RatAB toxin-antitoxin module
MRSVRIVASGGLVIMPGHTDNSVIINAPMDVVWDITNDIERWPELFSEYAEAKILEREDGTIRFRLTMHPDADGNAWTWVSARTPDVATRTVRSHRVERGWFEYMKIYWEYQQTVAGVRMHWVQDFQMKPDAPLDDNQMAEQLNRNTVLQMDRIKGLVEQAAASQPANPALDFTGKKILITGGTRGIGRSIVLAFARAGASVVTCYRNDASAADSLVDQLKSAGTEAHIVQADVTNEADIGALITDCRAHLGNIDVIVNNAGSISHVPFGELSPDEWRRVIDGSLTSAYAVIQAALPMLSPGASIINIGSRVAFVGMPHSAHYTAAKAGLVGLTRSLCKELGPLGYRINVVAPGPVETEEPVAPEVKERYRRLIALGRLGRPADIARVVLFLASDLAAFVTGETINVDGGI